MNENILLFFAQNRAAFPLYEYLEKRILTEIEQVSIKVAKSQISFYNKRMFACVSFMRLRKKADCPQPFIVLTMGLERKLTSRRIDVATEPYPNRWTHHILISDLSEIDDELLDWLKEAAAFSAQKR